MIYDSWAHIHPHGKSEIINQTSEFFFFRVLGFFFSSSTNIFPVSTSIFTFLNVALPISFSAPSRLKLIPFGLSIFPMMEHPSMKHTNRHAHTSMPYFCPLATQIMHTITTKAKYVTIFPMVLRTARLNRTSSPMSRDFLTPKAKSHRITAADAISQGIMCSSVCDMKADAIPAKLPRMVLLHRAVFSLNSFQTISS